MSRNDGYITRARISDSAEILFAAKGFHGTCVDEIASHARVNKATIYYHFESKQAILEHLTEGFLESFVDAAASILENNDIAGALSGAIGVADGDRIFIRGETGLKLMDSFLESWFGGFIALFKSKRNILRIMFTESMMDGENQRLPFRLSDIIASGDRLFPNVYEKLGLNRLSEETIILKFFGSLLPLTLCAIYEDAWAEHYGMTSDALYKGMLALFRIQIMGYFSYMSDNMGEI